MMSGITDLLQTFDDIVLRTSLRLEGWEPALKAWGEDHPFHLFAGFAAVFFGIAFFAHRHTVATGPLSPLFKNYRTDIPWRPFGIDDNPVYTSQTVSNGRHTLPGCYVVPMKDGILLCCYGVTWVYPKILIPWHAITNIKETFSLGMFKRHEYTVSTPDGDVAITFSEPTVITFGLTGGYFNKDVAEDIYRTRKPDDRLL